MPIIFALMIVMIGAQVIAGIYGLINPFTEQMGEIQHYNIAYYGAIASVERAELVLRKHTAGFEGSGGIINKVKFGPSSDYDLVNKQYFGLLGLTGNNNGIFWKIKNLSKSGLIPEVGKGDLDPDISFGNNFYKLTFNHSLQIALYKDISDKDKYYTGYDNLENIKPISSFDVQNNSFDVQNNSFDVQIRVPQKICKKFNNDLNCTDGIGLDDNTDIDGDGIKNDIIVNRSLFGLTGGDNFSIMATTDVDIDNKKVNSKDTNIREDVINQGNSDFNIKFDTTTKDTNPIERSDPEHTQNVDKFNQTPEDVISTGFDNVFNGSSISKLHAKFSLINFLKYDDENVYPYLEIKVTTNNGGTHLTIPDTYFHIIGEGKVGEYDVKIKISKPVFETTAASDFTVIF